MYRLLSDVISGFFTAYWIVLFASAVVSYIPDVMQTGFGQLLNALTAPYVYLFRKYIRPLPVWGVQLDLSYMIGVIVFFIIESAVKSILFHLVGSMPVG